MTYSRILLGTDLSVGARVAAGVATQLGHPRTRYRVAFVEPPAWPTRRRVPGQQEAVEMALGAWADEAGLPNHDSVVREGGVARELARAAQEFNAELVAVGSRGAGRRRVLGSIARSLVRSTPTDALVARGKMGAPIERVLLATDFHEAAHRAAARARDVVKHTAARLFLFHSIDPSIAYDPLGAATPGEVRAALADLNKREFHGKARTLLARGRPGPELAKAARENGIDLVVVGNHGAGPLERAMLGSAAESIVERAGCSVLVVRG